MLPISRGRLALAGAFALAFPLSSFMGAARAQMQPVAHPQVHGVASVDVAIDPAAGCLGQPQFQYDESDNAWWTHASTPGTH